MDKLKIAMSDYETLIDKTYKYELLNNNILEVNFKKENFPHVIGLHKITDIRDLERLNKKKIKGIQIYKKLKSGLLSSQCILLSPNYSKIKKRVDYFHKVKELVFEKVIYDFDKSKLITYINADLVLYTIEDNLYLHLFLVKNKFGKYVPMTFIVEDNDKYIKGQDEYNIKSLSIESKDKKEIIYTYIKDIKEIAITEEKQQEPK